MNLDRGTADALARELLAATAGRTALIVTHRPDHTPDLCEIELGPEGTFGPVRTDTVGASSGAAHRTGDSQ